MRALTVTHAFGEYTPGDQITDKADIKSALASNPGYVVAINLAKSDADAEPGSASQKKAPKADDAKSAPDAATPALPPPTAS